MNFVTEEVLAEGQGAAGENFLGILEPAAGDCAAGEKFVVAKAGCKRKKRKNKKAFSGPLVSFPESSKGLDPSFATCLATFKATLGDSSGEMEFVSKIITGLQSHGLKKEVDTHNISGLFESTSNVFRPVNDMRLWIPSDGFSTTVPVVITIDVEQGGQLKSSGKWIELPFAMFSASASIPTPVFAGEWPAESPLIQRRCACWDVFKFCEHDRESSVAVEEVGVASAGGGGVVAAPKTIPIIALWSTFSRKLTTYESLFAFVEDGDVDYVSPLLWTSSDRTASKNRDNIVKDYIGACTKEADMDFDLAGKLPTSTTLRALAQGRKAGAKTYIEMAHECVEARRAQHK